MEALNDKMEEKETELRQERDGLVQEINENELQLQKTTQALESEKQAR